MVVQLMRDKTIRDYLQLQHAYEQWFQTSLGRKLLADQRSKIDIVTQRIFGYQQLELPVSHRLPMGNSTSLGHKMMVVPQHLTDLPESTMVSLSHELAVRHDSVDLAILHHTLDFATSPHQALREASQVVKSSGYLLIVGFNPISLWGLRKLLSRKKSAPWNGRFISGQRIEDWLSVLDFEVSNSSSHFYRPPFESYNLLEHFSFMDKFDKRDTPMGAYYMILAKKQVGCSISAKPRWQKAKVIGMPVANRVKH